MSSTGKLAAFAELTKPRITVLLVLVAAASFVLASTGFPDWLRLAQLVIGIWMLAAGLFALNQYLERDLDTRMRRTRDRPLPSGRLRPSAALWFGVTFSALAIGGLSLRLGWLTGVFSLFTLANYLFVYTPLKLRTFHHTTVGAFSGATPPLLGWVAASGRLELNAWVLFAILFLWQFPHFLAIGMLYAEDYRSAGVRVLPALDLPKARRLLRGSQVALVGTSLLPAATGLVRLPYLAAAALLGIAYLLFGLRADGGPKSARRLLTASVLYLPLLFGLLLFWRTAGG